MGHQSIIWDFNVYRGLMKLTTRDRIIAAAIQTLASNPVSTLDEIAEAAGVGRATLYRHFESRKALIKEMITDAGQKMEVAILPILTCPLSAEEKLAKLVRAIIPMGASLHFTVYEPLHHDDPEVIEGHDKVIGQFKDLCRGLKTEGIASPDVPEAWLVASLDMMIFTAWESIRRGDIAANDAPDLVLRTYLSGIGAARNPQS